MSYTYRVGTASASQQQQQYQKQQQPPVTPTRSTWTQRGGMANQGSPSRGGFKGSYGAQGQPVCTHGRDMVRRQSRSEANPGRFFYACPFPQVQQCKCFIWEDMLPPGQQGAQAPNNFPPGGGQRLGAPPAPFPNAAPAHVYAPAPAFIDIEAVDSGLAVAPPPPYSSPTAPQNQYQSRSYPQPQAQDGPSGSRPTQIQATLHDTWGVNQENRRDRMVPGSSGKAVRLQDVNIDELTQGIDLSDEDEDIVLEPSRQRTPPSRRRAQNSNSRDTRKPVRSGKKAKTRGKAVVAEDDDEQTEEETESSDFVENDGNGHRGGDSDSYRPSESDANVGGATESESENEEEDEETAESTGDEEGSSRKRKRGSGPSKGKGKAKERDARIVKGKGKASDVARRKGKGKEMVPSSSRDRKAAKASPHATPSKSGKRSPIKRRKIEEEDEETEATEEEDKDLGAADRRRASSSTSAIRARSSRDESPTSRARGTSSSHPAQDEQAQTVTQTTGDTQSQTATLPSQSESPQEGRILSGARVGGTPASHDAENVGSGSAKVGDASTDTSTNGVRHQGTSRPSETGTPSNALAAMSLTSVRPAPPAQTPSPATLPLLSQPRRDESPCEANEPTALDRIISNALSNLDSDFEARMEQEMMRHQSEIAQIIADRRSRSAQVRTNLEVCQRKVESLRRQKEHYRTGYESLIGGEGPSARGSAGQNGEHEEENDRLRNRISELEADLEALKSKLSEATS